MQAALDAATREIILHPLADTWEIIQRVAQEHNISAYELSVALRETEE